MCVPLIVFDIGSTLVMGPANGPAGQIAQRLNLSGPQKALVHQALMTMPFDTPGEVADMVRRDCSVAGAQVDDAVAEVWVAQEGDAIPLPGAADAISRLIAEGYRFAVVSNIWLPYLTSARRHFSWFFDGHVPASCQMFSFREGRAKPSAELLRKVLGETGTPANRAVMVGDSYLHDVAPAMTLGMRSIWLLHQPQKETTSVARVINRTAPPPSLALGSIVELDPSAVSSALSTDQSTLMPQTGSA